jgi:hypothetical protein
MHWMRPFFGRIEEVFSIAWLFSNRVCCTRCQLQPPADAYALALPAVGRTRVPAAKRVLVDSGDGPDDRTADHC